MSYRESKVHYHRDARTMTRANAANIRSTMDSVDSAGLFLMDLRSRGVDLGALSGTIRRMQTGIAAAMNEHGMDSVQPAVTSPSVLTPVQFLQGWLPGFVHIMTAARKADEIAGITTIGSWEDEQVVQGLMELLGTAVPYGDTTNVPFASYNTNFVSRTVVRFELGMTVGTLDAARASRINVDSASSLRESCGIQLEIARNTTAFYGYNNGGNNTYGYLNEPGLLSYNTVPVGASGNTQWSTKKFLEITADIRQGLAGLRTQLQGNLDVKQEQITLVLPTNTIDYLSTTSDFGISVADWLKENYPNVRVIDVPEFDLANGGANVAYMFLERVNDTSTDGGQTFIQMVPAKFKVLGVEQKMKAYNEDFTNATAGVMCKRPVATYRYTGI